MTPKKDAVLPEQMRPFFIPLYRFYLPISFINKGICLYNYPFRALMAFKIAITDTPTSANTASHILAAPKAPIARTINFTPRAKTIFCITIRSVLREIRTTAAIFLGSSSIRTISAASIAASDPMLPIAIPTSARESTGRH